MVFPCDYHIRRKTLQILATAKINPRNIFKILPFSKTIRAKYGKICINLHTICIIFKMIKLMLILNSVQNWKSKNKLSHLYSYSLSLQRQEQRPNLLQTNYTYCNKTRITIITTKSRKSLLLSLHSRISECWMRIGKNCNDISVKFRLLK